MSKQAKTFANGQLTELVFILDRSGSMAGLESDTMGGFNSMVRSWKEKELPVLVTTVLFDNEYEILHDRLPIGEIRELGPSEYFVRGSTALYDAVGRSIEHVNMIHRYIRREDQPARTIVVVTTDGYENASRRFTREQVSKLVADMRGKDWEFVFVGADLDADEMADHLAVDRTCVFASCKTDEGIERLYGALDNSVQECLLEAKFMSFVDEFRTRLEDPTTGPDKRKGGGSRKSAGQNSAGRKTGGQECGR